jgi:tubulin--tyrosine ligase-like protein 12
MHVKVIIFSQVDIPGPLGNHAISILESLPNLTLLNGVSASNIVETGKHVVDSALKPRVPEWSPEESLAERVIGAMWLYLMTYRLADAEKLDETPIWYEIFATSFHPFWKRQRVGAI